jgi:hypothetical protein
VCGFATKAVSWKTPLVVKKLPGAFGSQIEISAKEKTILQDCYPRLELEYQSLPRQRSRNVSSVTTRCMSKRVIICYFNKGPNTPSQLSRCG